MSDENRNSSFNSISPEKEYEIKWQYVMHTESIRSNFIKWFFTVNAAVFAFLYSEKSILGTVLKEKGVEEVSQANFFLLSLLASYSLLTLLRLLTQKKNLLI